MKPNQFNLTVAKAVWGRLRRPSRSTLEQLERAGAAVDYWPEYKPVESRIKKNSGVKLPVTI